MHILQDNSVGFAVAFLFLVGLVFYVATRNNKPSCRKCEGYQRKLKKIKKTYRQQHMGHEQYSDGSM
jgi:hypothetical protein